MFCECSICNAKFAHKNSLKQHIQSFHEGQKPFKCNECDARFTKKQNLNKHNKSVLVHKEKKKN